MRRLGVRERQIAEQIAWGASIKEVANSLSISYRTVDNALRKVKEKIGVSKNTEVSAWWFCTEFNISFDLSPLVRKNIAKTMLIIFVCSKSLLFSPYHPTHRTMRRVRIETFCRNRISMCFSGRCAVRENMRTFQF